MREPKRSTKRFFQSDAMRCVFAACLLLAAVPAAVAQDWEQKVKTACGANSITLGDRSVAVSRWIDSWGKAPSDLQDDWYVIGTTGPIALGDDYLAHTWPAASGLLVEVQEKNEQVATYSLTGVVDPASGRLATVWTDGKRCWYSQGSFATSGTQGTRTMEGIPNTPENQVRLNYSRTSSGSKPGSTTGTQTCNNPPTCYTNSDCCEGYSCAAGACARP